MNNVQMMTWGGSDYRVFSSCLSPNKVEERSGLDYTILSEPKGVHRDKLKHDIELAVGKTWPSFTQSIYQESDMET